MGFTLSRPSGTPIVKGVRESPDPARLSGGEGSPATVLVLPLAMAVTRTGRQRR